MLTLSDAILALPDGETLLREAVSRARRRARYMNAPVRHSYRLVGGPFDGAAVSLCGPSTAVITVAGMRGRYDDAERIRDRLHWRAV